MSCAIVWFRRDLRHFDHAALHQALARHERVYCLFVFDRGILDGLGARADRRVDFIHASLGALAGELDAMSRGAGGAGSGLVVRQGDPRVEVPRLARELGAEAVYCNRDYEPYARRRDAAVARALAGDGCRFECSKDQVIFECDEVLTQGGTPFSVFTPYRKAWQRAADAGCFRPWSTREHAARLAPVPPGERLPTLEELGFEASDLARLPITPGSAGGQAAFEDFLGRIEAYRAARDFPARKGVSYLSLHLRFGTVSIRELAGQAFAHPAEGAQTWLSELVWRDFYHMILWHHPRVARHNFRPEFDRVRWRFSPGDFTAWCRAETGYPLVDAAMRQLRHSGYMHNRLRMVTASFLTKDLGIDWREGERFFAALLNDYDLAANNGGWQWAASTGCDAQPWFRIFNPVTQSERFDPRGEFIRRYLPELASVPERFIHAPWKMSAAQQDEAGVRIGRDYPSPIVDHAVAREETLKRFEVVRRG